MNAEQIALRTLDRWKGWLYLQNTANYHVMANSRFTFILSTLKLCNNIFMVENYVMQNGTLTSYSVQYIPVAVLYSTLLECIFRS